MNSAGRTQSAASLWPFSRFGFDAFAFKTSTVGGDIGGVLVRGSGEGKGGGKGGEVCRSRSSRDVTRCPAMSRVTSVTF